MNQASAPLALLLAVIWPLLLAVGVAFRATRPLASRFVSWAALPALATAAALADTGLRLPGVLLGSALRLDGAGRAFLLLNATLFLTAGLLARAWPRCDGASRFAVLLLLAPIRNGLAAAIGHGRRMADTRLPFWRDTGLTLLWRLCSGVDWRRIIGRFESDLSRWPTALVVLALLGLIAASLGASA